MGIAQDSNDDDDDDEAGGEREEVTREGVGESL